MKIRLFIYTTLFIIIFILIQYKNNIDPIKVNNKIELTPILNYSENKSFKYDSIIRIVTNEGTLCTSVVIDNKYALTAAHCVHSLKSDVFYIFDRYNNFTDITAIPVATDSLRDVALLQGDFKNFDYVIVDFTGAEISAGMVMRSCGFPGGQLALFCTNLYHSGNYFFQYRTIGGPIFQGESGGPVYNIHTGHLIGINSAVSSNSVFISPLVGFKESIGM